MVQPETSGARDLGQFCRVSSTDPELLFETGVPGLFSTLSVNGQEVHLLHVHTRAPFSPYRARRFKEQLEAITAWCRKTDGLIIVAGDMNAGIWSSLFRQFLNESGLVSVRDGFGVLGTWPSFLGPLATPLDQIAVSPQIGVLRCWVGPSIGSDHRPLLVDLCIPHGRDSTFRIPHSRGLSGALEN
jgi:endonuclease/exonuclease/phosphatase (EEP) superfamily protein YafD